MCAVYTVCAVCVYVCVSVCVQRRFDRVKRSPLIARINYIFEL